jgi:hypothetical protein
LIESEPATTDHFDAVRKELNKFYRTTFSRTNITKKVDVVAKEYGTTLGGNAEFWYLLAIGIALANPQAYGHTPNRYLDIAVKISPDSPAGLHAYLKYCKRLRMEIDRRCKAGSVSISPELKGKYWIARLRTTREIRQIRAQLRQLATVS